VLIGTKLEKIFEKPFKNLKSIFLEKPMVFSHSGGVRRVKRAYVHGDGVRALDLCRRFPLSYN